MPSEKAGEYVDLHSHSTASDGTLAPAEVARLARDNGLAGWALTDHDTVAGLAEAAAAAREYGITFLPALEISCLCPLPGGTLHILGYGVDPASRVLHDMTAQLIDARNARNPRIVAKLNELGVALTMEEVEAAAGGEVVGRPHIAAVLLRKGYVSSMKQAFDKYLAQGGPAYVEKERNTPRQAFDLIRRGGGLPFLAHPVELRTTNDGQLERVVKDLLDLGLAGIEVLHSEHDAAWVAKCDALADRLGLLKSGGSDFHGSNKYDIRLGAANGRRVPKAYLDAILEKLNS